MKPEIWLSPQDLKNVWTLYRKRIVKISLLAGLACAAILALQPPRFVAEATFKQSGGRAEQNLDLKNIFRAISSSSQESATQSVFYSYNVLRKTIEELGWQASAPHFRFENVIYDGKEEKTLPMRFLEPTRFEIGEQRVVAQVGTPIEIEGVSFTCVETPKELPLGKTIALKVVPWKLAVDTVKPQFSLKQSKIDSNVLLLKFTDADPHRSAAFLNAVMKHYQRFLHEENQMFTDLQLGYLEQRKKELENRFDQTLEENVAYLLQNLGDNGFISLQQEMETLSIPKEHYTSKLFDLQFELTRFEGVAAGRADPRHTDLDTRLATLAQEEKKMVQQQRVAVAAQQEEAEMLLRSVETSAPMPAAVKTPLASLVQSLKEAQDACDTASPEEKPSRELALERVRGHLTENLRDFLHALHLRQQTLEIPGAYLQVLESDFRGLDLPTARQLHINYHNELDRLHIALKELLYLRDQMQDPAFDLGSMAASALDPITQKMIEKAGDLEAQLQDVLHRSPREHERLKDALAMQKKYIGSHIGQTVDLHKIRIELTREKIGSLQQVIVDLLNNEKKLIEEKLKDLKVKMATLPQKWRIENLLKLKTDLTKKMVEGLVQITEAKILNRHLFHVESRPLDAALVPDEPQSARILFFSMLTAATVVFGLFFFYLLRLLLQGIAPTAETLRLLRLPFSGPLSRHCDSTVSELINDDLETLRRMATSLEKYPCAALFLGNHANFAPALAELLSTRGRKTVAVDCNFHKIVPSSDLPGLWHFVMGADHEVPLRRGSLFDTIPAGSTTRHATELFLSPRFPMLLQTLRKTYDSVLLVSRASLGSTEAEALQACADIAFVSYSHEASSQLVKFSRQKEEGRVSFVQHRLIAIS